ncbi:phage recombination protein Bet [Phaeobacter gallaeciensis]|uniref:phage recombination protein Bet n=1 Tax=Phaeobacter gallaeciensis TaxID=60890 RepID=UPI002380161D|nr:phage recombination protein Bet [Phaeobacter gallaeciensis]MDE4299696.1 phage recombination protein Bet [Phaeobacter gallaeciensis]MDE5184861.1 phage recombination protein Bet [Phaeobacter gallaeciensis]
MNALADYSGAQLLTIKNTVAKDTNDLEFDLFMNAARSYGLDPFRKQISAIVFNKDDEKKRQMAIIVGRDGLRALAARCGDYRPSSEAPEVVYDESLKSPSNPKGIVSVSLRLWKQDNKGDWHPVFGQALYDEFAPLKEEWSFNQEAGRKTPSGRFYPITGNWAKMPVVMLTKCAEGQALRAGWPDRFSGLYAEEEMEAAQMRDVSPADADMTPSERIEKERVHHRENAIGGRAIMMTMDPSGALLRIPVGEVADRCMEFIREADPVEVHTWSIQNREPLREFWAASPNDALAVKAEIEKKTANLGEAA